MKSPRKRPGHRSRVRMELGLLCITVIIVAALPASALATPPNDDFSDAENLGSEPIASASGTTVGATAEPGEPDHLATYGAASVWYRWTAPANRQFRINLRADSCQSQVDTVFVAYTGSTIETLVPVAGNWCEAAGSRVRFNAVAGTAYQIAVASEPWGGGSFELELQPSPPPPPNDDFANAEDLGNGLIAWASGTNLGATVEPGEPDYHVGPNPATVSVWYRWTAPASGEAAIDTCASDFDTVLAVYTGSAIDALTWIEGNDDACWSRGSRVEFTALAGATYRIVVDSYFDSLIGAEMGTFGEEGAVELRLALTPSPTPPNGDQLPISNQFSFGKLIRKLRRGTAALSVRVPGPGTLVLRRTKRVRGATRRVRNAAARALLTQSRTVVRLPVRPRGKAKRRLSNRRCQQSGKKRLAVRVRARVTYRPTGGAPRTRVRRVRLVKRC
jgi:hypothetical protein